MEGKRNRKRKATLGNLQDEKDDRIIKQMEKKLKLKRRKNGKLPQNFYDEGLGDILDVIDGRVNPGESSDEEPTLSFNDLRRKMNKTDQRNEVSEASDASAVESDDDNNEGNDRDVDQNESADDDNNCFDSEVDHTEGSEEEGTDESDVDEEAESNECEQKEDIYGFVRDKHGNVIHSDSNKIILPEKELDEQVVRRVRGLLNRITAQNINYVSGQIEDIFKTNSLYEVCQSVVKCITGLIVKEVCVSPQKLISEVSMLIAVLHNNVGEEVGGHVLHSLVKTLDDELTSSANQLESKTLDNIIALICNIYACNVINSALVFDILNKLCDLFNEKCIELIILILRFVGFVLRKDNPLLMKEFILKIREKASNSSSDSMRVTFMLETLTAVRNNNILKITADNSGLIAIDQQAVKSAMKNCLKGETNVNCIHGGYKEVLSSNRWWIKSGDLLELKKDDKMTNERKIQIDAQKLNINEKLCRKLRLNTPLRKVLFNALITSNDYLDASQRLLSIARKQAVEIVNVVLHVSLHQKEFNHFYCHLLRHLSEFDRKFKVAIFYALKDKISEMASLSQLQRDNLWKMTFELMKLNVTTINVLKVIEFSEMNETYSEFLKNILSSILNEDTESMQQIFSKIPKKDTFAAAIRLFICCFIDSTFKMNS
ncbi:nucleolar MIF4G domain-containing protein 1-like protein [Leptotrombidium deliense]|uniref:Nucleolar MIF4G domain-containing protein 1-like protein n=1 Tax=Leptotrombidium deliense TaxID=299467 RepID=A0A443SBW8_9ACAR|nr:nucleolar MIF4G domain-containing protein 1-like protein [Leptotrombidium deliense]